MGSASSLIAASLWDGQILGTMVIAISFCAIPVLAILTRHQRQMAEIIHGRRNADALQGEIDALRDEVSELRSQLRALNPPKSVIGEPEELTRRLG